ncbi:glycosyltransferase [Hyphomicrobium sp. CS1GBMeth3]|uniref:glycosyltransferase family 2 protein n=1 Tax=Hyphomicrobium sp. CS1GBMeth3 TaxID=1892845 RepID=UPI0009F88ED8|nr:glycosyltransferase [Hyphomicrobium sp. CS1GBMeth3]
MMQPPRTYSPSISVVIPLYNGADHIARALDGVFAQTVLPREVIIVDDGSEDDGADRVRDLESPVPLHIHAQPNAGQSAARNRGVSLATGDWIAFLDQDDIWRPRHLEKLHQAGSALATAPATSEPGWVYANVDLVDAEDHIIQPSLLHSRPGSHPKGSVLDCLRYDMFVLPSAALVSRRALKAVDGFDIELKGYEDDDLFSRLMRAGYTHGFVDEPLVMYRFHDASSSRSAAMVRSLMLYAEKLLTAFPNEPKTGSYPARDIVAPRFRRALLAAHARAVLRNDGESLEAVKEATERLRPHLSARAYWTMRGLMRALSHTVPAKAGLRIGRWLHGAAREPWRRSAGGGLTLEATLASSSGERDQRSHGP